MAAAALKVSARKEEDGGVTLGVTIESTFVPFVSMSGARVGQLVENGRGPATDDGDGDDNGEGGDES